MDPAVLIARGQHPASTHERNSGMQPAYPPLEENLN